LPPALRGWRAPALFALIAIVGIAAAIYVFREPQPPTERRAQAARLMNDLMSGKVPVGGPFKLMSHDGKATRLADFRGKPVLLYFGFLSCPDVCPTDLQSIAQAVRALEAGGEVVQPLFVTLDPQRDARAAIGAYATSFHPRFVALTGSEAEVRRVTTDYKVFFEKVPLPGGNGYTIDHAAFTFLLDREGRYVGILPPGTPAERIVAIVRDQR
jgi:cytochrome oxidase Cu insertion factor (SCO1/SenC/PrrC family)